MLPGNPSTTSPPTSRNLLLTATPTSSLFGTPASQKTKLQRLRAENRTLEEKINTQKSRYEKLEAEKNDIKSENRRLNLKIHDSNSNALLAHKFLQQFDSPTISLTIGPQKKRFVIHIEAICAVSQFFKQSLSDKDTTTQVEDLALTEETYNPEAFGMLIQYCYFGVYYDNEDGKTHPLLLDARVYTLAELLVCPELKKFALEKASRWCHIDSLEKRAQVSQELDPWILDAIYLIYPYTEEQDSAVSTPTTTESNFTVGNGFREVLARLVANYVVEMRENRDFIEVYHANPEFCENVLLFLTSGPILLLDDSGEIGAESETVFPEDVGESETISLQDQFMLAFQSWIVAETWTIIVGVEGRPFHIHSAALECSGYFNKIMVSRMTEGQTHRVVLNSDVDDAEAFSMFSQYCYCKDYIHDEIGAEALKLHAKVYVLAEKLECLPLKDLSFRKANSLVRARYSDKSIDLLSGLSEVIITIYEHTYDSHYEKLFGENRKHVKKESSGHGSKEKFRLLIASFASYNLIRLSKDTDFVKAYRRFPDFATDVMLLAGRGEEWGGSWWSRMFRQNCESPIT